MARAWPARTAITRSQKPSAVADGSPGSSPDNAVAASVPVSDHAQAGFTLIEVVVATVLISLVMALSAQGLRSLGTAAARGEVAAGRVDMVGRGLALLRRDLERIERVIKVERGSTRFDFAADATSLSFILAEPAIPADPGTYRVTYSIRATGDTVQLVRGRSIFAGGGRSLADATSEADSVVVLEGPYRMAFSYFDGRGPRGRWLKDWKEAGRLPDLIRFETGSTRSDVPATAPVVVRPRVDAEPGCIGEQRVRCTATAPDGALLQMPNQVVPPTSGAVTKF